MPSRGYKVEGQSIGSLRSPEKREAWRRFFNYQKDCSTGIRRKYSSFRFFSTFFSKAANIMPSRGYLIEGHQFAQIVVFLFQKRQI